MLNNREHAPIHEIDFVDGTSVHSYEMTRKYQEPFQRHTVLVGIQRRLPSTEGPARIEPDLPPHTLTLIAFRPEDARILARQLSRMANLQDRGRG